MKNQKTITAIVIVALLANPATVMPALAAGSDTGVLGPNAAGATGFLGNVPDYAATYGVDSRPGWFVTVDSSSDLSKLESWTNGSTERTVIRYYNGSNTILIAAPTGDIHKSGLSSVFGGGLSTRAYVDRIALETTTEYADPIHALDSDDAYTPPPGAFYARAATGGAADYNPSGMAFSGDTNQTYVENARKYVGAADGQINRNQVNGEGVTVAVIDTGVNFANGTIFGTNGSGSTMRVGDAYDFVEDQSVNLSVSRQNVSDQLDNVSDPNGHGTWVASASVGRDGMAPNATLLAYRALNKEGKGRISNIISAIERADRQGADIIIMSLGSPVPNDMLARTLESSVRHGNVTAVFVAAGNSYMTGAGRYISSPADVNAAIGVQATNPVMPENASKAYFGNVGPDPGVGAADQGTVPETAAPGMNLTAPTPTEIGGVVNTTLSGTSMAAPIAGGVGALVLDADSTLVNDSEAFQDRIVDSGAHTPHLGLTESKGGMVNATRAINGYDSAPAPDRDLSPDADGRDAGNSALAGDTGRLIARASAWTGNVTEGIPG